MVNCTKFARSARQVQFLTLIQWTICGMIVSIVVTSIYIFIAIQSLSQEHMNLDDKFKKVKVTGMELSSLCWFAEHSRILIWA